MGPDLDLDESGHLGADRRVGPPATGTRARIGRRIMLFGAFFEPGPPGAAMAGRAAPLAAPTPGARRLPLLALAAEQRLRQHRPGRAKLRELGFQRLDPALRCLRGPAQTGHLGLQGQCVLRRAAGFLRLLDGRVQLAPRCLEARFPRTRIATGDHFSPAQLFGARLRLLRPRPFPLRAGPFPLIRQTPVARLAYRRRLGQRPGSVVPGDQGRGCVNILDANRHGRDHSAWRMADGVTSALLDQYPNVAPYRHDRTVTYRLRWPCPLALPG